MFVMAVRQARITQKLLEICSQSVCRHPFDRAPAGCRKHSQERQGPVVLTVGVTAGASTPERIIREVIQTMTEIEVFQNRKDHVDVSFSDFIENIPHLKRGATVRGHHHPPMGTMDTVYVDVHDKSVGRIPRHEFEGDPDFDLDKGNSRTC
jgi:4-hydroxy-3-methylbut-2-enyl diphosphate reductase